MTCFLLEVTSLCYRKSPKHADWFCNQVTLVLLEFFIPVQFWNEVKHSSFSWNTLSPLLPVWPSVRNMLCPLQKEEDHTASPPSPGHFSLKVTSSSPSIPPLFPPLIPSAQSAKIPHARPEGTPPSSTFYLRWVFPAFTIKVPFLLLSFQPLAICPSQVFYWEPLSKEPHDLLITTLNGSEVTIIR